MKVDYAYIEYGATHHFLHQPSVLFNYTNVNEEPMKGGTGIAKIIGKGFVKLSIADGTLVEAYHASIALLRDL